jgi:hypothetical protein
LTGPKLKLDRSRPFATCHGEGLTHAFEQDGLPFDHQGELAMSMVKTPAQKALVEKKMRRLVKLQAGAPSDDPDLQEPPTPPDDDDEGGDDTAMNFEAWLKDEVQYPQHEVFKEARRRFNKMFTNYKALAEFLVFEEQVLGPDDVPTKLGPKST